MSDGQPIRAGEVDVIDHAELQRDIEAAGPVVDSAPQAQNPWRAVRRYRPRGGCRAFQVGHVNRATRTVTSADGHHSLVVSPRVLDQHPQASGWLFIEDGDETAAVRYLDDGSFKARFEVE